MYAQDTLQEGEILTSDRDENGELRVNLGDSATGEGEALGVSLWAADGFFGRPVSANGDGACRALYHVEGNRLRCVGTKDNRFVDAYSELEDGDRAIVNDSPARFFMKSATSQIALYTQGSDDPADNQLIDLNGSGRVLTITISDGTDTATIQMKPDEINIVGGLCCINMKGGVLGLYADYIGINAGKGNLGVVGGVVPPPGSNSIIYGTAGATGVASTNWTIAP